jgi:hypothetical protein
MVDSEPRDLTASNNDEDFSGARAEALAAYSMRQADDHGSPTRGEQRLTRLNNSAVLPDHRDVRAARSG